MKTKLLRRLRREAKTYATITMVYLKGKPCYRVGYCYRNIFVPFKYDDAEYYSHIQDAKVALYRKRRQHVINLLREIKVKKANRKLKEL